MRLLLDENLPRKLKYRFSDAYEVLTVPELGWSGKKNGELLGSMLHLGIKVLISGDKNMSHQHRIEKYEVTLIVLNSKDMRLESLVPFIPMVEEYLQANRLAPGVQIVNLEE